MNAPHKITRDPIQEIDDAIAALVAYRAKPEYGNRQYLNVLLAFDRIEGNDALKEAIANAMNDLGLRFNEYDGSIEEHDCSECGRVNCICDRWVYVERIAPGRVAL